MTYRKIYRLKFEKRIPTHKLVKQFPQELRKIAKVSMLELPVNVLREIVGGNREFNELLALKQRLRLKRSRAQRGQKTGEFENL